jgi:multicomponent Na+:H+ antiporter subunit F
MIDTGVILDFSARGALLLLGLALLASVVRLIRGPSLPDRVIALDLVAVIVAGLTIVDAIFTQDYHFLRAAIALSLVSFIGTVAFSIYIQRGVGKG